MLTLELEHLLIAGLVLITTAGLLLLMRALKRTLEPPQARVEKLTQAIAQTADLRVEMNADLRLENVEATVKPTTAQTKVTQDIASDNAHMRRKRVKEIAKNFSEMKKKTPTEIVTTEDHMILEGEVPVYYNGELHKPKVVIMDPGSASPEETIELMEFARSKFIKEEEE